MVAIAVAAAVALHPGSAGAQQGAAKPAPPKGIRFIYLVRHGDYDHVDSLDEVTHNGLNALGHEQAKLTGERLKAMPFKINSLICSDYTRARETAQDMGRILGLTPVEDSLVHECNASSDRTDLMKDLVEAAACDSNLEAAWRKYFRPSPEADAHDVIVCHGNVTRWFTCKALGVSMRRWPYMDIANGSITVIQVRADGSTRLAAYSDTGHIPIAKQTWLGRGAGWTR